MLGVYFARGQARVRNDLHKLEPVPGEARVRVLNAGVCATDLALLRGYMGFEGVPGHEFVGRAMEGPLAGQRVVGEINCGCGECPPCRSGDPRHCPTRTVLGILGRGGAFAEELSLPLANLHPVPDRVSNAAATFTEPLAAAFEILEQVPDVHDARALVMGDGRLGLLCAAVLQRAGATLEVLGRHPERAGLLGPALTYTDRPDAASYDLVVEATGVPEMLQHALTFVRPRGRLILKTTAESAPELDLAPIVIHEITVIGSRCGPFPRALAALEEGALTVENLIQARRPLSAGPEALALAGERGRLKVLIDVEGSTS